ncbi:MAG: hypothetical protein OXS28_13775, partial [Gammaproteobacteria bacterium]|nr:hypothetical protein [Gammaproteobacteria bacterium]
MPVDKTTSLPPSRVTETAGATSPEPDNQARARQKTGSFFGRLIQLVEKHRHADKVAPHTSAEQTQDTRNSAPFADRNITAQVGASMTARPLPPLPPKEEHTSSEPVYDTVPGVPAEEEIYSTVAGESSTDPVYATIGETARATPEDEDPYVYPDTPQAPATDNT